VFGKGILPPPAKLSPKLKESSFPGIYKIYTNPALATIAEVGISLIPQRINLHVVHLADELLFNP